MQRSLCAVAIRRAAALAAFTFLLLGAPGARAAILVKEGFDYGGTGGNLAGNNGGGGFSGAWANGPGIYQYTPTGLTFGSLQVSGGAASFSSATSGYNAGVTRPFSATLPATGYGSYLLQATGSPLVSQGALGLGAPNSPPTAATVGFAAPDFFGGAAYVGVFSAASGAALVPGQTYLQVFKYVTIAGPGYMATEWLLTEAQFAGFKVGGLAESELNAAGIGSGAGQVWSRASFSGPAGFPLADATFSIVGGFAGTDRGMIQDELRISDSSIDEATPIPEPSTAMLVACVVIAAALSKHRKRR
jgi:hypothetical protein